jgi:hypothetical protein
VDYTYSGSYTLTCLAWVTLPGTYAPASLTLGVTVARKSPHPQRVLRQVGSPWEGQACIIRFHNIHRSGNSVGLVSWL